MHRDKEKTNKIKQCHGGVSGKDDWMHIKKTKESRGHTHKHAHTHTHTGAQKNTQARKGHAYTYLHTQKWRAQHPRKMARTHTPFC